MTAPVTCAGHFSCNQHDGDVLLTAGRIKKRVVLCRCSSEVPPIAAGLSSGLNVPTRSVTTKYRNGAELASCLGSNTGVLLGRCGEQVWP